jgi:predicted permease
MRGILQDIRFAVRQLVRSPGFALAAVVTLALGIGGATAVFSEINAVYLRPLAVHDPDRLVRVTKGHRAGVLADYFLVSDFERLADAAKGVVTLSSHATATFTLRQEQGSRAVAGKFVSDNYFATLGARPELGRFFGGPDSSSSDRQGVVLSHELWRRVFQADTRVIGTQVRVNGELVHVIGVAPEDFNGVSRAVAEDIWMPLTSDPRFVPSSDQLLLVEVLGRLAPGVTRETAQEVLRERNGDVGSLGGPAGTQHLSLASVTGMPGVGRASGMARTALNFGAAFLMLLLAAANVAGMLITRAERRRREVGVRVALGVRPALLMRQLLTESALLFLLGALGGVLLSMLAAAVRPSGSWPPSANRQTLDYGVDVRVVGFALAVALLTSVAFGILPAVQLLRTDVASALRNTHGPTRRGAHLLSLLAVGQIAASFVLLAFTSLLFRGFQRALSADLGFTPENVTVVPVDLGGMRYDQKQALAFHSQLAERVAALPQVRAVSIASVIPLTGTTATLPVEVVGAVGSGTGGRVTANVSAVTPDFFRTLSIGVIAGRGFTDRDRAGAPPVAVINADAARRWWPNGSAIGGTIHLGPNALEVVGVARDVQARRVGERPGLQLYVPLEQDPSVSASLLIRTERAVDMSVIAVLRAEASRLDPDVPLSTVVPLSSLVAGSLVADRTAAVRFGILGVIGLVVASVGVFGTLSNQVSRRIREIGTRIALGASHADILRLLVRRGTVLVVAGISIGLVASALLTRLVRHRLYGVSPMDPVALLAAAGALVLAASLSVYIPARRAASIDPMNALRAE